MSVTSLPRPLGSGTTTRTPPAPKLPDWPAGEPAIGRLGAVTGVAGSRLAYRCRACGLLVHGDAITVHAELRQHHRDQHGMVPDLPQPDAVVPAKATKPKTPRVKRTAAPREPWVPDQHTCAHCQTVFTRQHFNRRYCTEQCRRAAKTVWEREHRNYARGMTHRTCTECGAGFETPTLNRKMCSPACTKVARARRDSNRARPPRRREPADLTAWPKNRACDHCGGTFVVPTRRHERSRYCSQTCGNKVRNGRRGRGAAA